MGRRKLKRLLRIVLGDNESLRQEICLLRRELEMTKAEMHNEIHNARLKYQQEFDRALRLEKQKLRGKVTDLQGWEKHVG